MSGCAFEAHVQQRVVWEQLFPDHSARSHAQPGCFPCCLSSSGPSMCWLWELTCRQLEPWQHWRCCPLWDRVTDTNYWFFFFVYCKQRFQRAQSILLWTKCLPPISGLASPVGSFQSHPICSFPFSWRAWCLFRCILSFAVPEEFPAAPSAVSCILQFPISFFFSDGFVTKQSHSWGLHTDFVKEQGNMSRDLLHANTLLWWWGRWSSSRTVWGNRLLHSFVSPSSLSVMPFYLDMPENYVLCKLEKYIQKCIVLSSALQSGRPMFNDSCILPELGYEEKYFSLKTYLIYKNI